MGVEASIHKSMEESINRSRRCTSTKFRIDENIDSLVISIIVPILVGLAMRAAE